MTRLAAHELCACDRGLSRSIELGPKPRAAGKTHQRHECWRPIRLHRSVRYETAIPSMPRISSISYRPQEISRNTGENTGRMLIDLIAGRSKNLPASQHWKNF